MIINKKTDYCSYCGNYCEQNYGVENYDLSKHDLDNYFKYKDIYVYVCPKCGMVSRNLATEDKNLFESIKNTEKYKEVTTFEYLKGLDLKLFENQSRSVPASQYEVYALMYENSSDKETFLRALHKSIELKELILEKYEAEVDEDEDEEDEEILSQLEQLMRENINNSRKLFINEFLKYENKNEFLFIMFIENLVGLGEKEAANDNVDWILNNSTLDDDLADYVKNLTNEE